jgi:hypothetical protein
VAERPSGGKHTESPGERFVDEIGELCADREPQRRPVGRRPPEASARERRVQEVPDGEVSLGPHVFE